MELFSSKHLKEGVSKKEIWAWSAFDFANSGYTTVVLTAVFNSYFVGVICGNASWATLCSKQHSFDCVDAFYRCGSRP